MKKLYCPACSAYLEGGSGDLVDCRCGWMQPEDEPEPFEPDWVSAPGDTISDILEEREWSVGHFADLMDMSETEVVKLIAGITVIDDTLAESLSDVLECSVEFWLERDKQYRFHLGRLGKERPLPENS